MTRRRAAAWATLLAGLCLIAIGAASAPDRPPTDTQVSAARVSAAPDRSPSSTEPLLPVAPASPLILPTASPFVAPSPEPPLEDGWRIQITRLGIDLPLREGDIERDLVRQSTPEGAAFLLPGTVRPGTRGNAYVYSHARTGMFLALWRVALGDLVEIVGPDGMTYRYEVTEIHPRVGPTELSFVQPTSEERLTLQTSTGPNGSDPRFVVVALRDRG